MAIDRTTPVLLGLFSLVTLWADELYANKKLTVRAAGWYRKSLPTFSDALASVRHLLWTKGNSRGSRLAPDPKTMPPTTPNTPGLSHMTLALALAHERGHCGVGGHGWSLGVQCSAEAALWKSSSPASPRLWTHGRTMPATTCMRC
jgi:hypothetical protein